VAQGSDLPVSSEQTCLPGEQSGRNQRPDKGCRAFYLPGMIVALREGPTEPNP
jgi:hypothetical protein